MEPQDFNKVLRTTVIMPILLLSLLAGVLVWQTAFMIRAMTRLDRSARIISDSRTAMRLILEMETGVRGFLVTGEEQYLDPYRRAEPQIEPNLKLLQSELADDPSGEAALAQFTNQYRAWREYSKELIDLRRTNGNYQDSKINLQGKNMMDAIRESRERLMVSQERLRDSRAVKRSARHAGCSIAPDSSPCFSVSSSHSAHTAG